jgi:hypothetical protein
MGRKSGEDNGSTNPARMIETAAVIFRSYGAFPGGHSTENSEESI